ncbi:Pkinase-domain-containing protein [Dipodascopsis tothii]|uniref:Pkinase-domain-containing protein n=1 Tax=Dipodascopsis tothii TaxID=44089 RepID=UPI0034CF9F2E
MSVPPPLQPAEGRHAYPRLKLPSLSIPNSPNLVPVTAAPAPLAEGSTPFLQPLKTSAPGARRPSAPHLDIYTGSDSSIVPPEGLQDDDTAMAGYSYPYSADAPGKANTSAPQSNSQSTASSSPSLNAYTGGCSTASALSSSTSLPSSVSPSSGAFQYQDISNLDVLQLDEAGWETAAKQGDIVELGRLGEGTSGSVTKCKLKHGSTVFALKTIPANPNPEIQRQILRELLYNKSCHSPHIVKYYGRFVSPNTASISIAMEFCAGGSLDSIYTHVKARGGRIGEKVLGRIAEGVLSGLSYLHERKIIHRDIKPQNILLDGNGQVKLCDFGVSGEVVNSLATTFTGTSYYMAPERIQGQPYTVTSDVWSLGLTLMEVAQHRFPFPPEGQPPLMPIEILSYIVNMQPPELMDEPQNGIFWSDAFRHFLVCCLEKDTKRRASPRQMLSHPWIVGISAKKVHMDRFVRECWAE